MRTPVFASTLLLALAVAPAPARDLPLVFVATRAPDASARVSQESGAAGISDFPRLADANASLRRWVERSAGAVAGYFGRLPVPRVTITMHWKSRGAVGYGVTHGGARGARIDVDVGPETDEAALAEDWVLTHELVHTAVPRLPRAATWLDEGLATYVEPIARVRHGDRAPEKVWGWLAWGLPKGMPRAGDEGLDTDRSWGRTYWGGALFCFLADVALREETKNRVSLRDALAGVVNAGGNVNVSWDLEELLAAADRATGTRVLTSLHARMGAKPLEPDLPALFASLGVRVEDGRVSYDDAAPLAAIRRTLPSGATDAPEPQRPVVPGGPARQR
ncbi:MAG TPA: hypothetical protein VKF32_14370 [Thermoanaerobaculia bacterium]|nr:hypothetical protein [Thermoanaerobaculia bacterium]